MAPIVDLSSPGFEIHSPADLLPGLNVTSLLHWVQSRKRQAHIAFELHRHRTLHPVVPVAKAASG
jgi:hypothetical protein